MRKRISALIIFFGLCITLMTMTVSAATPSMTGTLSNGKMIITIKGLGSNIAQVEILATNKNDAANYMFDTAVVLNGTATQTFMVTGTDYIVNATTKNSDDQDQDTLSSIEVSGSTTTSAAIGVTYASYVQKTAWQSFVNDGAETGTIGKSLMIEAITIKLTGNVPTAAKMSYEAYVQKTGWMSPVSNGTIAGTIGKSLRLEAFKTTLSGMPGFDIEYRAYVQSKGWQSWQITKNGTAVSSAAISGTTGKSLMIEAIEIKVVKTVA